MSRKKKGDGVVSLYGFNFGSADANPSVRLGDTTCRAQHLATYAWGMYADMRIEIYY